MYLKVGRQLIIISNYCLSSKALLISKRRQAVNNNKQLLLIINSFEKCISCIGIKDVSVENHYLLLLCFVVSLSLVVK